MRHVIDRVAVPPPGLSTSEAARRSGVSRATLHRLSGGDAEPSLATLRDLAILHGLDVEVSLVPLSDPAAAIAARRLLEGLEGAAVDAPEVDRWIARLHRLAPGGEPVEILRTAARASSLLHRRGAVFFRGDADALRLASAGDATGGTWAVSGRALLDLTDAQPLTGPSILRVEDVAHAAELLADGRTRVRSAQNAHVIIAEADAGTARDAFLLDGVRYVAPIQMLLDGIGLGGRLEERALEIAEEWSR